MTRMTPAERLELRRLLTELEHAAMERVTGGDPGRLSAARDAVDGWLGEHTDWHADDDAPLLDGAR